MTPSDIIDTVLQAIASNMLLELHPADVARVYVKPRILHIPQLYSAPEVLSQFWFEQKKAPLKKDKDYQYIPGASFRIEGNIGDSPTTLSPGMLRFEAGDVRTIVIREGQ